MAKARILIIDDEESPRESLRFILKDRYDLTLKENGATGVEAVRSDGPYDIVLLDMKMPDMTGLDVLTEVRQLAPATAVVMITAITDAKPAVEAMKLGAADYLNKPFDVDEIRLVVERILRERSLQTEVGRLRSQLQENNKFDNMVGSGPAMQKIYTLIQRLRDTETTVLITGETGTGKELVARAAFQQHAKGGPVHGRALRGDPGRVARERTVRPREGLLYRRAPATHRHV